MKKRFLFGLVILFGLLLFINVKILFKSGTTNMKCHLSRQIGNLFLPQFKPENIKQVYEESIEQNTILDSEPITWDDAPVYEVFSSMVEEKPESGMSKKERAEYEKKLMDEDTLLSAFYQVDPTTCVGDDLISFEKLKSIDLTIDNDIEGPKILIYHTHSTEGYSDSREGMDEDTVIGVGDYLKDLLENEYGIEVMHHKGRYDLDEKANAYKLVAMDLPTILEENPSIQVVIDLHRDGVDGDLKFTTVENGKKMAQVMFFNGICRDSDGEPMYGWPNENLTENLAFSFQMHLLAKENYHDLVRKIYLRGYRYNMHLCKRSMLIEVGAQTNTVEEAKNAMVPVAKMLSEVLLGTNET